jgi:hypothetical protein
MPAVVTRTHDAVSLKPPGPLHAYEAWAAGPHNVSVSPTQPSVAPVMMHVVELMSPSVTTCVQGPNHMPLSLSNTRSE